MTDKVTEDTAEKTTLEDLPIHALRRACKDKKITFKNTDKKVDLIKMLRSGETIHKPREVKRAPILQDSKTKKSLPIVPKEIRPELEEMAKRGLKWTIDENSNCINFMWHIPTCANLDQPANNILKTAKAARGGVRSELKGRGGDARVEWA